MTKSVSSSKGERTLADLLARRAVRVEAALDDWLVEPDTPAALADAMRYCVMNGGKRLRPALVLMAAEAVGGNADDALTLRAAASVELIHAYSLVHDDLPAMDDDTMRRGLPTAHVAYGEAMAILVGDALLTRAFGVLAEACDDRAPQLVAELAAAAGSAALIAGQVADMGLCALPDGRDGLDYIHHRKTAALIRAAGRMGALAGGAAPAELAALTEYGLMLGLAFQAVDDLLDTTGDAATLGKTPGKDDQKGRPNLVALLGRDGAGAEARCLSAKAVNALAPLGPAARDLCDLADLLADRTY